MRCRALSPASLAAATLVFGFASHASAEIVVNIDKTTQSMTVTVDGSPRYIWPVSTGRPGYDTPNGIFKANRMDADHLSQEWDNAPMPHTIFFDMHGHAIHGFLDTRRLGSAASHGCVRLSPEHAATLYSLVETEGMKETTVIVRGRTPAGPVIARRTGPTVASMAPRNGWRPEAYGQPPAGDAQPPAAVGQPLSILGGLFGQQPEAPSYGQGPSQQPAAYGPPPAYGQRPPAYGQRQPYPAQSYYVQQLSNGQRVYYVQPGYPPPPQYAQPFSQD
jgi:L,D-transpeptidase catalytic domain